MEQKSILDNITEHDVVTVHNPMEDEFKGKVARSVVAPRNPQQIIPTGNSNADAFAQGISQSIANNGHTSMAHVQQTITLQAGQTLRLPGDVARVVVRQLVKEMMQREKATKRMSDPVAVREFEERVVLNHASMLSNLSVETVEERMQRQLDELNDTPLEATKKDEASEQAFPTETTAGSTGTERSKAGTAAGSKATTGK